MSNKIDGILQIYEGTDVQCNLTQKDREITFSNDIGAAGTLRYKMSTGQVLYFYPDGDSTTTDWQTATVAQTGWASGDFNIKYQSTANTVNIQVECTGLGDGIATSITLPFISNGNWSTLMSSSVIGANHSTLPVRAYIENNSNVLYFSKSTYALCGSDPIWLYDNIWGDGATKVVSGQIFIQIAG